MSSVALILRDQFGLTVLPNHVHTIILSAGLFHLSYIVGGWLSNFFCYTTYSSLSPAHRIVWRVKVVSFFHAVLICGLALPILSDKVLLQDKVFGYTPYSGMVYAVTCGYFVWDIIYVLIQGQHVSFLFHGIACLIVFLFSFSPIFNYYGAVFLMYELSTPFLNIGYFMDKCGHAGSIWAKLNAMVLLLTFFLVRLTFGYYMSYKTFESALAVRDQMPVHLQIIYGSANILLNSLNLLWFIKLFSMVSRRITATAEPTPKMPSKIN